MGEEMRKKEAGGTCRPCFVFSLGKEDTFLYEGNEGVLFCEEKYQKEVTLCQEGAGDCGRP